MEADGRLVFIVMANGRKIDVCQCDEDVSRDMSAVEVAREVQSELAEKLLK